MAKTLLSLVSVVVPAAVFFFGCAGEPGEREYRSAIREIERGKNVRALAMLEKSITKRPASEENALAYNYIGIAAWRLGRIPRAVEAFESSSRLSPGLPEPVYNLAALYYEAGDFVRAGTLFEQVAEMDVEDARALEFLGSIYLQTGKPQDARRVLFAALARDPQSPRILTALALVETAIGEPEKAIFFLMQALEKQPEYPPALYNLGMLNLADLGDEAQAAAYLARYLDAAPAGAKADEAEDALARLRQGEEQRGEPPPVEPVPVATRQPEAEVVEAAAQAEKTGDSLMAEARDASASGRVRKALNLCMEAAGRAERAGDVKRQEEILLEAVDLCLDQARAHAALARFLYGRERYEEALSVYKQAAVLDPGMATAHMGLADAALQTGEYDAALVALKQVMQLEKNNPDPLWMLATLYDDELGATGRAAEIYRVFERRFPGDPRVVRARERLEELEPEPVVPRTPSPRGGESPAVSRRSPDPVVTQPRAVVTPPGGPRRLKIRRPLVRNTQAAVQAFNRGTLYQQQEDWERAVYFYTRALENDDTFVTAYFNLGSVYMAKGDYDLAKDAYRRAIEIQPQGVAARYNLALLHRELGEREEAIGQIESILESNPDYAQAHYVLGLFYSEDEREFARAKVHYRKFLELSPNDPAASIVRDWINSH